MDYFLRRLEDESSGQQEQLDQLDQSVNIINGEHKEYSETIEEQGNAIKKIEKKNDAQTEILETINSAIAYQDCEDIRNELGSDYRAGVHTIYLNLIPVKVYCDSDGWTVIQSRGQFGNPQSYFYRNWVDYLKPFGTPGRYCVH